MPPIEGYPRPVAALDVDRLAGMVDAWCKHYSDPAAAAAVAKVAVEHVAVARMEGRKFNPADQDYRRDVWELLRAMKAKA